MYKKQIEEYIESQRSNMLSDLETLVRIGSIRGEALPGKPYGENCAAVLAAAQKLLEENGLKVTNYDNYVLAGDYGEGEKELDILAHLDVVPVTDKWTITQPFEPLVVGDRIYGRGTCDDKGPAIAALYAIKCVKALGIPLKKSVRILLGSDEECGSSDLEYYYAREEEAPWTFTPDANFPVINLEKARLRKDFQTDIDDGDAPVRVLSLHGGDTANIVPSAATAQVLGLSMEETSMVAQSVAKATGTDITLSQDGEVLLISVAGQAAHASTPSQGRNATTALLTLLDALPLSDCPSTRILKALIQKVPYGDTCGEAIGVAMADEPSGALTLNFGVLKLSEGVLSGNFDIRAPLCATQENLVDVIDNALTGVGFTSLEGDLVPAHYVPADSPFVKTLLDVYELYSGQKGEALYTGGGTYVHHLKRGVAFGCEVEGVDNHMHGDDEFMEIPVLLMSAKMFAEVIIRLCT